MELQQSQNDKFYEGPIQWLIQSKLVLFAVLLLMLPNLILFNVTDGLTPLKYIYKGFTPIESWYIVNDDKKKLEMMKLDGFITELKVDQISDKFEFLREISAFSVYKTDNGLVLLHGNSSMFKIPINPGNFDLQRFLNNPDDSSAVIRSYDDLYNIISVFIKFRIDFRLLITKRNIFFENSKFVYKNTFLDRFEDQLSKVPDDYVIASISYSQAANKFLWNGNPIEGLYLPKRAQMNTWLRTEKFDSVVENIRKYNYDDYVDENFKKSLTEEFYNYFKNEKFQKLTALFVYDAYSRYETFKNTYENVFDSGMIKL